MKHVYRCPFCSNVEDLQYAEGFSEHGQVAVHCGACKALGPTVSSRAEALARWNRTTDYETRKAEWELDEEIMGKRWRMSE